MYLTPRLVASSSPSRTRPVRGITSSNPPVQMGGDNPPPCHRSGLPAVQPGVRRSDHQQKIDAAPWCRGSTPTRTACGSGLSDPPPSWLDGKPTRGHAGQPIYSTSATFNTTGAPSDTEPENSEERPYCFRTDGHRLRTPEKPARRCASSMVPYALTMQRRPGDGLATTGQDHARSHQTPTRPDGQRAQKAGTTSSSPSPTRSAARYGLQTASRADPVTTRPRHSSPRPAASCRRAGHGGESDDRRAAAQPSTRLRCLPLPMLTYAATTLPSGRLRPHELLALINYTAGRPGQRCATGQLPPLRALPSGSSQAVQARPPSQPPVATSSTTTPPPAPRPPPRPSRSRRPDPTSFGSTTREPRRRPPAKHDRTATRRLGTSTKSWADGLSAIRTTHPIGASVGAPIVLMVGIAAALGPPSSICTSGAPWLEPQGRRHPTAEPPVIRRRRWANRPTRNTTSHHRKSTQP